MTEPGEIILRLTLMLQREEPERLAKRIETYQNLRRQTKPLQRHAGPLFKNPGDGEASQLIEQAGLKGLTRGMVQLAPQNANSLVNLGGASAQEVIALMTDVYAQVLERLEIRLRVDLEFQGRWEGVERTG